ncbi:MULTISPECIES: DUF397 domain-containing protein [Actinokineospora]|uniref:DUF397 domain-containing protein n=1 Tax=Actinokineospora terrae TaxID=155974 RepID=A0A1H9WSG1_9PSEU|nr:MULTISPECIES: DUF397 domain-containing protein [Actinokineospora]MCP2305048.1 protein of unknown function (DUF397) [Actinokineospora globicatena]GLW80513.1 hypothetical protein Aglo01_49940 [Actinokineospora globicatena]GLW87341.1 hypothetical protein Aglo02_49800 [Actinokineospora globicatena]SES36858.1 protein of unknown function [Actinokineospora terrae]
MNELQWRRSSRSGAGGGNNACVEVAMPVTESTVYLRDSKNAAPTLRFTPGSFATFLTGVTR